MHSYKTLEETIGRTPLVRLQRIPGTAVQESRTVVLAKLEGNNPAGSVKDRAALAMINGAEAAGLIKPGSTLIEATSGNTGIALAMAAAIRGYKMVLVMPDNQTTERMAAMQAYGARLVLTPANQGGMEHARDLALSMQAQGKGIVLNQFSNPDNYMAHFQATGPEIWEQTAGKVTHFISAMGTTGTIMGVSKYLKSRNPAIKVIGVQPAEGASIPGIRKWPKEYEPAIYKPERIDKIEYISQQEAEEGCRRLAASEGIFAGVSSGGAMVAAMRIAENVSNATVVFIACDRGDRYLSTGVFKQL